MRVLGTAAIAAGLLGLLWANALAWWWLAHRMSWWGWSLTATGVLLAAIVAHTELEPVLDRARRWCQGLDT